MIWALSLSYNHSYPHDIQLGFFAIEMTIQDGAPRKFVGLWTQLTSISYKP